MSEPPIEAHTTIKQLADQVRVSLIARYGEATLAKWCLSFDKGLIPDPSIKDYGEIEDLVEKAKVDFAYKYISVLHVLAFNPNHPVTPVALIWLDGHGWGKVSLQLLAELIIVVKDATTREESSE